MTESTGNLWDHYRLNPHAWLAITTNGVVRADGACVMGRGIARQAADRWPGLPYTLGGLIQEGGNHVYAVEPWRVLGLPVKHRWDRPADLGLITRSLGELAEAVDSLGIPRVYMPRPGCGNGGLRWEVVRPLVAILDDRFCVVEWRP